MRLAKGSMALALAVLMLAGLCACGGSGKPESEWLDAPSGVHWVKGHSDLKVMNMHTEQALPGAAKDADGNLSEASMRLYQDKDGYFARLAVKGEELSVGAAGTAFGVELAVENDSGNRNSERYTGTAAGDGISIRISGTMIGAIQSTIGGAYGPHAWFVFHAPDGMDYVMSVPTDSDYWDVWQVASDRWYVPTEDDSGFNADRETADKELEAWLDGFYKEVEANVEAAEKYGNWVEFLAVVGADGGTLSADWGRFREMENLSLTADYELWASYRNDIERLLAAHGLSSGYGVAGDIGKAWNWLMDTFG